MPVSNDSRRWILCLFLLSVCTQKPDITLAAASVALHQGDIEKADRIVSVLLMRTPESAETRTVKGRVLAMRAQAALEKKDLDQAYAYTVEAEQFDPNNEVTPNIQWSRALAAQRIRKGPSLRERSSAAQSRFIRQSRKPLRHAKPSP
jgi:ATP/maltotriose-dependent transcriptional regulator MalT